MYTLRIYAAFIRCVLTCIRCGYTLQLYVLYDTRICAYSHVYATSATHICVKLVRICCINTFFSSMYTLRVYAGIIRCINTFFSDIYTLQLYAAIIRSISTCIRCGYTSQSYAVIIRYVSTCIRCNYTLQLYVMFRHVYVATIRCNYTFGAIRVYVHFCTYTLLQEIAYTCICGPVYVAEYGGFVHIYAIFAKHVYVL